MLRFALFANAASCALFGALFLLNGEAVAVVLGEPPMWLLHAIGAGLIANAAALIFTALRPSVRRRDVLIFAAGDAAWVIATIALVLAGLWVTTPGGVAWTLAVAAMVGMFGLAQWRLAPAQ